MSRPKLKPGLETVPLVVHVPKPFKLRVVSVAKNKKMPISQYVRETLTRAMR